MIFNPEDSKMATMRARPVSNRYAVVVGFDFTPSSEAALVEAIDLAGRRPGGEVHAVYALKAQRGLGRGRRMRKLDARIEEATTKLRAYITTVSAKVRAESSPSGLAMHVRVSGAATAIIQAAVDLDADLVVVGTRNATGVRGLVTGSTGSKVMKAAHCPVLVVRSKDYVGLTRSARIEPQCSACVATRLETRDANWWCARHGARWALPPHAYSYAATTPFGSRNTDVEGPLA